MGKYVDGKENIKLEDLSEYCSGVVVNGKEWQRKLAEMLSSYLPLTEIMANPVDYPKALLKEVVNHPKKYTNYTSDAAFKNAVLEDANDDFFLKDKDDWKKKFYVRDGLDPQDKKHIMMTYTEKLDKFKAIVYEEVRCIFRPTEINGLFAMDRIETFTNNIHNTAIRSAMNISDFEYMKICRHGKQRSSTIPVCLDGVKVANVLNMDWYESQMVLVHRDGRVLQLDNGNRYGDLITKEYPCKSVVKKPVDLSVEDNKSKKMEYSK